MLLHPKSRGRVSLRSADPRRRPRIEFNALAEPEDLATLRRGLRAARHIYATSPQADLIEREVLPGADVQSDAELDAYIRATAGMTQHPVGTCSMAPGPGAWSMRSCACSASTGCASPMRPSCRPFRAATPMARCS